MRQFLKSGSVRGAARKDRPYRDFRFFRMGSHKGEI